MVVNWIRGVGCTLCVVALTVASASAATPSVEQALKLVPIHRDVDYDRPAAEDVPKCAIAVEKTPTTSGWVVKDPNGVVLRRFIDTNADNVVDLWCYYRDGLEVYRDVDSAFTGKANEFRWLGPDGSRWGMDTDKDGKLDRWKMISAEEVTAEVALALANKDLERFQRVMLGTVEMERIGLPADLQKKLKAKLETMPEQFTKLASEVKGFSSDTRWLRFDANRPGIIPAALDGSSKDVIVYENVVSVVDTAGTHRMVQIGTLVYTENGWRTIDLPAPLNAGATELADRSFFFEPALAPQDGPMTGDTGTGMSEKIQELLSQLEKLDKTSGGDPSDEKYHAARCDLLEQLFKLSATPNDREQWGKQLADTLSVAVQTAKYTEGVSRLAKFVEVMRADPNPQSLAAYVEFRYVMAEYAYQLQEAKADFGDVQKTYVSRLESFVTTYPDSPDAADAYLQLGITEELSGKEDIAKKWYQQAVVKFPSAPPAQKAAGALKRIDSIGKPIKLSGVGFSGRTIDLSASPYKGRIVLIDYWATWCQPCMDSMEELKKLHAKYGNQGFTVIGVNLDGNKAEVITYLKGARLTWDSLYEPGGLEGKFANDLGILTLPTKILIDQNGNVVDRNIHISQVEDQIKKLLPKK